MKPRQIFTDGEERDLAEYLVSASNVYFGLCPKEIRKLAFEYASANSKVVPDSWKEKKEAGADWLNGFLRRHHLSLRVPEPTSYQRATGFNKANVSKFYDKLEELMDRYKFTPNDIWNLDETGMTTVQKPRKTIAPTGQKQVGGLTSAERGQLVTVLAAVNPLGCTVAPMMVFPRVHYREHFIRGGPPGCIGGATKSGWMDEENFKSFMVHFVQSVKCSKERPVLLLLDNVDAHLRIDVLNYAKDNGVHMLSFPAHCSHKLQPLDLTVFGPLKNYAAVAMDSWMRNHPGQTMTIYDIPEVLAIAWPKAATPTNCSNGFKVPGISPLNRLSFSDSDVAPSATTDQPEIPVPEHEHDVEQDKDADAECTSQVPMEPQPDSSAANVDDHHLETPAPAPVNINVPSSVQRAALVEHLSSEGLSMTSVRGDGHCLLYCIVRALDNKLNKVELCDKLLLEAESHINFYSEFAPGEDVMAGVRRYIISKDYNTNVGDLILNAICNALDICVVLFVYTNGNIIKQYHCGRNYDSEAGTRIQIAFYGNDAAAHYDLVTAAAGPTSKSPENIRPIPKATPRVRKGGGRKRHTAILTDTPEKDELAKQQAATARKKMKSSDKHKLTNKGKASKRGNGSKEKRNIETKKKKSKKTINSDDDSDEEVCFCMVCMEEWSNSRSGESWIQCIVCKHWAHEDCTPGMAAYVCHNCDSE